MRDLTQRQCPYTAARQHETSRTSRWFHARYPETMPLHTPLFSGRRGLRMIFLTCITLSLPRFWLLGIHLPAPNSSLPAIGSRLPAIGSRLPAIGSRPPATGKQLAGDWQQTAGEWQPAAGD